MKILVVDDMISMRHVMLHMLRSLDYTDTDEAPDGCQAFDLLQRQHYDLVITDYHMPKMDGMALLRAIREDERLAKLPVIMVSCEDEKDKIKAVIQAQVTDFIVKPFNQETLAKKMKHVEQLINPDICIV
ncbi:response regulator [Endozoicomonas sp. G2_1]|uniref:response regulator n=1 Tax=Endozoicomonas sp. G2_1 TaxID=2821091 RepID=UPI001ADD182E|nr:response regulator [Endozoicomonas sp. G2_1]MBO9491967.1 response regulator [Endozoicomonas sp. G2_1]